MTIQPETQGVTNNTLDRIQKIIAAHDVVLFMKGTQEMPMCGFSGLAVRILKNLGVNFFDINVLDDPEIRQGIKEFTNWPTIPQLYIKQDFIGGADIIRDMYETGELEQLLREKNLCS